ncbi:MAG: three-Cys-motif partner protein TcmP [Planctomycetales bacterium]|nr:three-Cys-motif partner protein TcmP [Planctomycetales bacterium]
MSDEHHTWKIGSEPPIIRPHSLAKHRVLRAYLERYVATLTKNPRQDVFRLTLVDGFAGGGKYTDSRSGDERPGSPIIMLEAMERAAEIAQQTRSKPFNLDVNYIYIEKNPEALEHLRAVLNASKYAGLLGNQIRLLDGEFVALAPNIIKLVKGRGRAGRVIFVLDQCGYTDVPFPTLRSILHTLPNAEVILTFATDFLIDYLSEHAQTQRTAEKVGLSMPPSLIRTAKEARNWRRIIQFSLHEQIPHQTGAKFYTPFFIRSADSHRDFWLIHLSGHYRARDVMVGLHWEQSTDFAHYGRSGLNMLGYDERRDVNLTSQKMLPGFYFDDTAFASSHDALLDQLPEKLYDLSDGMPFGELFSALTNECPVTAEIMKNVLGDLSKEGIVEVRDKTATTTRRVGVQHDTDIIIPSRQKRLFLP